MSLYTDFYYRNPTIWNRYSPSPNNSGYVHEMVNSLDKDPKMTARDRADILKLYADIKKEYKERYGADMIFPKYLLSYEWCPTCEKMVSLSSSSGAHKHCKKCKGLSGIKPCKLCMYCCRHQPCKLCQGCHGHICGFCARCVGCCNCARFNDHTLHRKALKFQAKLMQHKENKSDRLAGVEWEFNSATNFSMIEDWKTKWEASIHHDGSCGREAVTPPMSGDHLVACLKDLGTTFSNAKTLADERCGIHVHVNADDLSWEDVYRLLAVYAKVEPLLYLLGGQDRADNQYCHPCGNKYQAALDFEDREVRKSRVLGVAMGSGNGRADHWQNTDKKGGSRYKGLNLMPWLVGRKKAYHRVDTTIEFRIHRNSLDSNRIINWTKLCIALVDWAVKSSDVETKNLPKSALATLLKVAPESKVWILSRIKEWRDRRQFINRRSSSFLKRRIVIKQGKWSL